MTTTATISTLVLFVFYAVSFTKFAFDGIAQPGKDTAGNATPGKPALQNGVVRLWALLLGVTGALVDYFFTTAHYDRTGIYTEVKLGAAAAVGAIVTYHIGPLFKSAFDGADPSPPPTAGASAPPVSTATDTAAPAGLS